MPIDPTLGPNPALSAPTAAVATPVTPPLETPPPGGLDAATNQPSGPTLVPSGTPAPGGVSAVGLRANPAAQQSSFWELSAAAPEGTVSFPTLIAALPPEAVQAKLAGFGQQLGVPLDKLSPQLVQAAKANPALIADLFTVTPRQLSQGMDALTAKARAKGDPTVPLLGKALPASGFQLENAAQAPIARAPKSTPIFPGLVSKDANNPEVSDAQHATNAAWAEAITRLADNPGIGAAAPFSVGFGGQSRDSAFDLFDALKLAGYQLSARSTMRAANFAALMTESPDGSSKDAPWGPLISVPTSSGKRVPINALHAAMEFELTSPAGEKASFSFFQGIDGNGFRATGGSRAPAWCGHKVMRSYQAEDAWRVLGMAAIETDVLNRVAEQGDFPSGAYGESGTCLDSVSRLDAGVDLANGKAAQPFGFPLIGHAALLAPFLAQLSESSDPRVAEAAKLLSKADLTLPDDASAKQSPAQIQNAMARADDSQPWAPGQEPFKGLSRSLALLRKH